TGAFADRFGRKHALTAASVILALALFVYAHATTYLAVLLANLATGLAITFRSGADTALLYDSLKEGGREGDFQWLTGRFWGLRASASLAGLLVGAHLAAATSYSFAIAVGALLPTCAFPLGLSMYEPKRSGSTREPYLHMLAAGVSEAWRTPSLRYIFLYSAVV